MTSMITRCPKCSTTFKISADQLSAAGGAVRCGACLTVFNGQDHLTDDSDTDTSATQATTTNKSAPKSNAPEQSSISFDEDEMMIHDDMADDQPPEEAAAINISFDDQINDGFDNLDISANPNAVSSDESWAEELLAELEDDDIDDPLDPMHAFNKNVQPSSPPKDHSPEPPASPLSEQPSPSRLAPRSAIETPIIDAPSARLVYFEEEPLELEQGTPKRVRFKRFLALFILSAIALTALVTQVAIHKFDTLALDDRFRAHYAATCSIIGCTLPKQQDLSKIRVTHTSIKHDSSDQRILIIELIIKNTAHFKQPYPNLNIYFDDSSEEPVASRHIKPSEYLKGQLTGSSHMPINQPVRIKIPILDPGEDALYPKVLVAQ